MHGRHPHRDATAEVEGGTAAGTVSQEIAGADEVAAVVAAAEQLARTAGRPRTPCRWWRTTRTGTTGPPEPETTGIEVLGEVAKGLGEAFDAGRGRPDSCCSGSPSTW